MKLTPEDIEDFYSKYVSFDGAMRITKHDGSVELTTKCPFHADDNPSLSINLAKGLYKCHAASCTQSSGGNIYQFFAAVNEVTVQEARDEIYATYKKEPKKLKDFPVTEDEVQAWHNALLVNTTVLTWIKQNCRYTDLTIDEFELGWDGKAITIPIRNDGQLVNVRQYTPKAKVNKYSGVRGFNTACLWPVENFDNQTVYLFEGEKDCMLANQLGLNAVTVTGGSGTFAVEWREYFTHKDVIICYDIDKAGKDGSTKVASILSGSANTIKIVNLPITHPANGDFTDYILQKNNIQDFNKLVDAAEILKIKDETSIEISDDVIVTTLENASYSDVFFKRLLIKVRILGKDLAPFIIPKEITASCTDGKKTKCIGCGLTRFTSLKQTVLVSETRPELLAFLNCTTAQQKIVLKQVLKIPIQCNTPSITYSAHQFVEEITAIPYIDEQTFDGEYLRRTMFVLNQKLEANRDYEVELLTVPDPRTQYLVHIVYKARPCETSIEEFKMSVELFEKLKVFQCQQNISETNSTISTPTCPQT